MKRVVHSIYHHWRIYCAIFKLSVMSRITYPLATALSFINVFFQMFIYIIFAKAIFKYIPHVGGFSSDQLYIIIGTSMLIEMLSWLTYRAGINHIAFRIRSGKIESSFVKPMSSQFLALFTRIDIEDTMKLVTALILIVPHISAVPHPTMLHIFLYALSLICGLAVSFGILSSLASLTFFFGKLDGLYGITAEIDTISKYPHTIFSKKMQWIFLTILPTAFIGSIPTLILTTTNHWLWFLTMVVGGLTFLYMSNVLWHWAESHYSGASG